MFIIFFCCHNFFPHPNLFNLLSCTLLVCFPANGCAQQHRICLLTKHVCDHFQTSTSFRSNQQLLRFLVQFINSAIAPISPPPWTIASCTNPNPTAASADRAPNRLPNAASVNATTSTPHSVASPRSRPPSTNQTTLPHLNLRHWTPHSRRRRSRHRRRPQNSPSSSSTSSNTKRGVWPNKRPNNWRPPTHRRPHVVRSRPPCRANVSCCRTPNNGRPRQSHCRAASISGRPPICRQSRAV